MELGTRVEIAVSKLMNGIIVAEIEEMIFGGSAYKVRYGPGSNDTKIVSASECVLASPGAELGTFTWEDNNETVF